MVLKGHGVKAGQPTAGVSTRLFCPTQTERKESFEAGRGIRCLSHSFQLYHPFLLLTAIPIFPNKCRK